MTDDLPRENQPDAATIFESHRDLLISVAYRILGRMTDAEDVVQDAWLRWTRVQQASVMNPRSFLVRVTTRLAIDRLRRIKAQHEIYVGPWLPEPLLMGSDVADDVIRADSVSMALLIVLETLSPLERAAFVLREVFAYSYAEIAEILGRGEPAVRQLASRAREHVHERSPRFDTDQTTRRRVTEHFLAACINGDVDALLAVLAPGVTLVADGGGRARAPLRPVHEADKVARFLLATQSKLPKSVRAHLVDLNGGPGIVFTDGDVPIATVVLTVADGVVQTIHLVANPDKLTGVRNIRLP